MSMRDASQTPSSQDAYLHNFALHNFVSTARLEIIILEPSLCSITAEIMMDNGGPQKQTEVQHLLNWP